MRIIVAGPPKTGNIWIKCLLAEIYNLDIIGLAPHKAPRNEQELETFIKQGWFVEDSIFHQHFSPTNTFLELVDFVDGKIVSMLRNPYDTFVSLYFFVQAFPKQFGPKHNLYSIRGKPLSHPDVLDFIGREKGFGSNLSLANKWLSSGLTYIIRYENLQEDPFKELKIVTNKIAPVKEATIREAIQSCRAQNMRKKRDVWTRHIRKASVGDWRNHLNDAHLEKFKIHYRYLIERLGYEVM